MKEKLAETESKQQRLLDEMRNIDAQLSVLTPSDPTRPALIAKKGEIAPRYRAAKALVKDLRRALNSTSPRAEAAPVAASAPEQARGKWLWDIEPDEMRKLYRAIANVRSRDHDAEVAHQQILRPDEAEAFDRFLDVMDDVMGE